MIRNYFKIALRNLSKHKAYSAINIFGLSVGIACCILIFLFVKNEWSYDTFHVHKERLYRLYASREADGGEPAIHPYVPMPLGPALTAEYPEIEAAVRFKVRTAVIRVGDNLVRERVVFTDPDFLTAFSFEPTQGPSSKDWLRDNAIVLSQLRQKWQELAANVPFEFYFLDNDVARQYRDVQRWDRMVAYSSILAIVIACLGLFGLSALSVSQRTKEIGVRKVLGASVPGLVGLINKEFLLLVGIGSVIAWPVGWMVMNRWLENFAYRIEMDLWVFVLAGALALVIALLTVSTQAVRAAQSNPVEALRYE